MFHLGKSVNGTNLHEFGNRPFTNRLRNFWTWGKKFLSYAIIVMMKRQSSGIIFFYLEDG